MTQVPKNKPKMQPEPRINISDGMTVKNVQQKGSSGQKIAASLFDLNEDGVYQSNEASAFNQYRFVKEKNKLKIKEAQSGNVIEIKFNEEKDIDELIDGHSAIYSGGQYYIGKEDETEFAVGLYQNLNTKTTIDLTENTATVENGTTKRMRISGKVKLKDMEITKLILRRADAIFENLKRYGVINKLIGVDYLEIEVYKDSESKYVKDDKTKIFERDL